MGDCCRCDAFRFFTPLRCVQNDRMGMAAFGMTGKGCCAALRMTVGGDDGGDVGVGIGLKVCFCVILP